MRDVFPEAVGLDPEVFEHAAELIADDRYCTSCGAIGHAAGAAEAGYHKLFAEIFRPEGVSINHPWWGLSPYCAEPRIIALLLLASEIVRDANGDTPAELPPPADEPTAPQSRFSLTFK